jgi:translocation and assembly module TamA
VTFSANFSLRSVAKAACAAGGIIVLLASPLQQARAQSAAPDTPALELAPAASPTGPAFDIRIEAPSDIEPLLEKHIALQRYRAVSDLDDAELARLIVLAETDVRELVATQGYFSPDIRITREAAPGQRPVIVVAVEPGAPTRIGEVAIRFEGDIALSSDEDAKTQQASIRENWRLPAGQPFTQEGWDGAKTQALRGLVARRYPGGRISYSLADIDAPARSAQLGLTLDSGPLYRLGTMQVSGMERYDPLLAPRLARLAPGSVYDQRALIEAQQRLTGSGYFDSAYVVIDPDGDPKAVPVQVQVREAKMQKVVLGVGVSTDSGPRASLEHTHNRLPGLGWRAVTKFQLERKSPFAQTEWTAIPDENFWRWNALARVDRFDDGELTTLAQRLRFGRLQAGDRIDRSMYVQYDRATVKGTGLSSTADSTGGEGSALTANYTWTGRYFDSLPFPQDGYALAFELGAGLTLGERRTPFMRTVGRWLGIHPLERGRIAMRAEAGATVAKDNAPLPATQLFRTGGDTTVRGYGVRDIGVTLPSGATGPGRYLAVASVEWQRPLVFDGVQSDWESVVFIDAGNVADRVQDLRQGIAVGVGAGARWKSPIGPLQIDLAYGVKTREPRIHLNVGFVF